MANAQQPAEPKGERQGRLLLVLIVGVLLALLLAFLLLRPGGTASGDKQKPGSAPVVSH